VPFKRDALLTLKARYRCDPSTDAELGQEIARWKFKLADNATRIMGAELWQARREKSPRHSRASARTAENYCARECGKNCPTYETL